MKLSKDTQNKIENVIVYMMLAAVVIIPILLMAVVRYFLRPNHWLAGGIFDLLLVVGGVGVFALLIYLIATPWNIKDEYKKHTHPYNYPRPQK